MKSICDDKTQMTFETFSNLADISLVGIEDFKANTGIANIDTFQASYTDWKKTYCHWAENYPPLRWIPFKDELKTEFNFPIYEFLPDGFYEYSEEGMPGMDGNEAYEFVKRYRHREDAITFMKGHNKELREEYAKANRPIGIIEKDDAEDITTKVAQSLISKPNEFLNNLEENCNEHLRVKDPNTLDWKEAMKALIEGKRIEARFVDDEKCTSTLWFEVEFAIGPEDKELGESVKFGRDWEYRILDDSQEREELFNECEKLGIINVSKVSKVSTSLLHDIVDSVKSINLDWDAIAKQINEETK